MCCVYFSVDATRAHTAVYCSTGGAVSETVRKVMQQDGGGVEKAFIIFICNYMAIIMCGNSFHQRRHNHHHSEWPYLHHPLIKKFCRNQRIPELGILYAFTLHIEKIEEKRRRETKGEWAERR